MPIAEGVGAINTAGGTGMGMGRIKWARADYSFSTEGGAVSTIALRSDTIPNGAVVLASYTKVDTVPTSAGAATVALTLQSAGDLQAAAAISGAPWSSTGTKLGAQTFTTAPIVLTAARTVSAVVGTAALTAGKFAVLVAYLEAPAA